MSECVNLSYGHQLIDIKVMLPPRLFYQIDRILLYCTESIGSLYQAEFRPPLGGVEYDVANVRQHELLLLWHNGQVVSHQAYKKILHPSRDVKIHKRSPSSFFLISSLLGVSSDCKYLRWSWSILSHSSEVSDSLMFMSSDFSYI